MKTYITIGVIVLVVAGGAAAFYISGNQGTSYEFTTVERGNISEEVSVTGRVKAAQELELAFETGGRISNFYAEVGDRVEAGDRLASVGAADLLARISQQRAALETQQAKLDELRAGTKPEEIELQKVKVKNAESALEDAKSALVAEIKEAYGKSDDAVRNKVDQFISGPSTDNPQLTFTLNDIQLEAAIEDGRKEIEDILNSWKTSTDALTTSSDLTSKAKEARDNLNKISLFLDNVALAINTSTIGLSGNTWKADVSTARTNVSAALSAVISSESSFNTAMNNLSVARSELTLKESGATVEQIAAQEAQVEQARAQLTDAQAAYSKTIINAPIAGIVTDINAKIGEIISANTPVIDMNSEGLQMEANLPEADVAKVEVGDEATITLDAYGNDIFFKGSVIKIDPAETILEGVATYKITLQFSKEDERIKPGMTANIDIHTQTVEGALYVPQRAIVNRGPDRFVRVLEGEEVVEIPVETGLRGVDGNIEIKSGLSEGQQVITVINE